MVYAPHVRFQMGGELDPLGTGAWNEVWQCTINGNGVGDPPEDAWLASRGPAVKTWFTDTLQQMSFRSRISWCKLNVIGADGKYTDPAHPHTIAFTPGVGYNSTSSVRPSFVALCLSWTTANLRGPEHTGRIYVPTGVASNSFGTDNISTADQSAMVTSGLALLTILNTTVSGWQFNPVIASKVDASNTTITGVRVGNIYDIQRRRKNKQAETYLAAAWP